MNHGKGTVRLKLPEREGARSKKGQRNRSRNVFVLKEGMAAKKSTPYFRAMSKLLMARLMKLSQALHKETQIQRGQFKLTP
jgi:hypothetical protein